MTFFGQSSDAKLAELFHQHILNSVEAGKALRQILSRPDQAAPHIQQLVELEHKSDEMVGRIQELFDKTFITRIEGDDMARLLSELDDVIDWMRHAADYLETYGIVEPEPEAQELVALINAMVNELEPVIEDIYRPAIESAQRCKVVIKTYGKRADDLLKQAIGRVMNEACDVESLRLAVKWRDIFGALWLVANHCEHVVQVVLSIKRKLR